MAFAKAALLAPIQVLYLKEDLVREQLQTDFGMLNVGLPTLLSVMLYEVTEAYNMLALLENIAYYLLQAVSSLYFIHSYIEQ